MNLRIRYFALLRETTEKNEETLTLPAEASVAALREMLLTRYPCLLTVMERSLYAVNHQYMALHCSTKILPGGSLPKVIPLRKLFLFIRLQEDLKRAHRFFLKTISRKTTIEKKSKMFREASGLLLPHEACHPRHLYNGEFQ
jgi:molybdopterin converting factor small subunit